MKTCTIFVQFKSCFKCSLWAGLEEICSDRGGTLCAGWIPHTLKPEKQIDLAEMNLLYSGCFKGIQSLWIVLPEQPLYEQSFPVKSSFHRKGKYP